MYQFVRFVICNWIDLTSQLILWTNALLVRTNCLVRVDEAMVSSTNDLAGLGWSKTWGLFEALQFAHGAWLATQVQAS